jgi:hypothetical protein
MERSYENISRAKDSSRFKDWIGTPEIVCLSNKSVSLIEGRHESIPSLVGKCMIVQPFVRQHAPEKDQTERCMNFRALNTVRILPFIKTKELQSEAYFFHGVGPEGNMAKTNRKVDDIPRS